MSISFRSWNSTPCGSVTRPPITRCSSCFVHRHRLSLRGENRRSIRKRRLQEARRAACSRAKAQLIRLRMRLAEPLAGLAGDRQRGFGQRRPRGRGARRGARAAPTRLAELVEPCARRRGRPRSPPPSPAGHRPAPARRRARRAPGRACRRAAELARRRALEQPADRMPSATPPATVAIGCSLAKAANLSLASIAASPARSTIVVRPQVAGCAPARRRPCS